MERNVIMNIFVIILVLFIMFQFLGKISKLKSMHNDSEQLLPLCKTLSAFLDSAPEDGKATILKTMENSYFRSIWITVYSKDGEVWADSFQPTYGQLPMPASDNQQKTFNLIKGKTTSNVGVKLSQFGKCLTTRRDENVSVAAVELENYIVCIQTCGCESC